MLEIVRFEIRRYAQNDLITQDWARHLIQQRMTSQPILEPWSGNLMMFLQEFDAVRCCAIGFKADGLTLGEIDLAVSIHRMKQVWRDTNFSELADLSDLRPHAIIAAARLRAHDHAVVLKVLTQDLVKEFIG